jgi:hypothetical protein
MNRLPSFFHRTLVQAPVSGFLLLSTCYSLDQARGSTWLTVLSLSKEDPELVEGFLLSLPILRIRVAEMAACFPLGTLVSVSRDPARVFYHPRHVHQVPGHERRVAVGEIVLGAA